MGVSHDFKAKILAQSKKNPDFETPEFSTGRTLRASGPGQKIFLGPKPFWVSSQYTNLDLHTP